MEEIIESSCMGNEHDELLGLVERLRNQQGYVVDRCATPNGMYIELSKTKYALVDRCATSVFKYSWSVQVHKDRRGKPVKPYAVARVQGILKYMHRFLWEEQNGPIPQGLEIDHINGDTLDNRLTNLRLVTHKENQSNQHKHKRDGKQ